MELSQKFVRQYKKYQKAYDYCLSSLDTYDKMCETDQRPKAKRLSELRENLSIIAKQVEQVTRNAMNQTNDAARFYQETDSLLNTTENLLLSMEKAQIEEKDTTQDLGDLILRFNNLQDAAISLIDQINIGIDNESDYKPNQVALESQRLIRLKLYTLWTKLRELEQKKTGQASNIDLNSSLKPDWTTNPDYNNPVLPPRSINRNSLGSSVPKLPPRNLAEQTSSSPYLESDQFPDDSMKREKKIKYLYNDFTKKLSGLNSSIVEQNSLPSDLAETESLIKNVDQGLNSAEAIWNSFQQDFHVILSSTKKKINGSDIVQKEALEAYKRWRANEADFRDKILLPRLTILRRLEDLVEDLSECQARLDKLSKETWNKADEFPSTQETMENNLRELSQYQSEAQGMRDTINAQEKFIESLFNETHKVSVADFNPKLNQISKQWLQYTTDLSKYENVVKSLIRAHRTLLKSNQFLNYPPTNISDLKQSDLEELINNGQDIAKQIEDVLKNNLSIDPDQERSKNIIKCLENNLKEVTSFIDENKALIINKNLHDNKKFRPHSQEISTLSKFAIPSLTATSELTIKTSQIDTNE